MASPSSGVKRPPMRLEDVSLLMHQDTGGGTNSEPNSTSTSAAQLSQAGAMYSMMMDATMEDGLPPDFRIQLQLLNAVNEQSRVLQNLQEGQERLEAQLYALNQSVERQPERISEHTEKHLKLVTSDWHDGHTTTHEALDSLHKAIQAVHEAASQRPALAASPRLPQTAGQLFDTADSDGKKTDGTGITGSNGEQHKARPVDSSGALAGLEALVGSRDLFGFGSRSLPSGREASKQMTSSASTVSQTHQLKESLKGTVSSLLHPKVTWVCICCGETNKPTAMICQCCDEPKPQETCMQKIVRHWLFDAICGIVITINAFVIGANAQTQLKYALDNPGQGQREQSMQDHFLTWFFVIFYCCELLLKLKAHGRKFFSGPEWNWNLFDSVLVVLALYEIVVADLITSESGASVDMSWLRILRLLKMLKMFRVVRLMRKFRILRIMLQQIAGSITMLFWAFLMLSCMMLMFALIFAHAISEYLQQNTWEEVGLETKEGIESYYYSLVGTAITLYMAVTGGSDWEPLAAPLKEASDMYYWIFLFYIAFSFVSVLNVVTGMFVDAAMKIASEDETQWSEETSERSEIEDMRKYFLARDKDHCGILHFEDFRSSLRSKEMDKFRDALEIELLDTKRVFKKLAQQQGSVSIEEFIYGCMMIKGDTKAIDMISLMTDTRRNANTMAATLKFIEHRFDKMEAVFASLGFCELEQESADTWMRRMGCLPPQLAGEQDAVAME
mmetsp:Transcript_67197/g.160980  ORF Transcript_67197/g.160980 Transcript_67197/m.160980 type:complete len:731 (-) Transcript_67197:212-2404(-)